MFNIDVTATDTYVRTSLSAFLHRAAHLLTTAGRRLAPIDQTLSPHVAADDVRTCAECHAHFTVSAWEQSDMLARGLHPRKRCRECLRARRSARSRMRSAVERIAR